MFHINKKTRTKKPLLFVVIAALLILIGIITGLRLLYVNNLGPVSSSKTAQYFTVEQGTSVHEIGVGLQKAGLIRNAKAFETYVKGSEYADKLQAGTYSLTPSMNVQDIVKKMINGDVTKNLLTILPGKNLDQIKNAFKKEGYNDNEIDQAFNPATYTNLPLLNYLPPGASLDGFLYPDSFQKQSDTPASTIVRESLDEMQKHLSQKLINGFQARGLSVYEAVTLASIVEREVPSNADKPIVAQIFLTRIKQGINLESDATTSVYNTYTNPGLPPKPISNVTASALDAVANPSNTDYLFFVSGDDGTTHFSKTKAEHDAAVEKYCKTKCSN